MLCSKCHMKEATVYYKQNINGEIKEYALCNDCAAETGLGFSPINVFTSVLTPRKPREESKHCTLCGSTFDEIKHSGKAGCAECYSVFSEELAPMIAGIHGSAQHKARENSTSTNADRKPNELDSLRAELRSAVEAENYERAAELRDMIKRLEAAND